MTLSTSRLTIGFLWSDMALCVPWLAGDPLAASPNLWCCCWDGVTACCCQSKCQGTGEGDAGHHAQQRVSPCLTAPYPHPILLCQACLHRDPYLTPSVCPYKPGTSNNQTSSHTWGNNLSLQLLLKHRWARHSTTNCPVANSWRLWLNWAAPSVNCVELNVKFSVALKIEQSLTVALSGKLRFIFILKYDYSCFILP